MQRPDRQHHLTSPSIEVGPARPEECAALGALLVRAYRSVDPPVRDEYAAMLADVAGRAADPELVVLAARLDGRPVGCVTIHLADDGQDGALGTDGVRMRMLGVDPEVHGSGAGRALAVAVVDTARRLGRDRVLLDTQAHMVAAQAIYASLGFRRRPERDRTVPGTDVHLMAFELTLER